MSRGTRLGSVGPLAWLRWGWGDCLVLPLNWRGLPNGSGGPAPEADVQVLVAWSWHMPSCLSPQTKIGAGRLMGPKGVAVDRNGHIIVVDNKACCVFIFQSNGKLVAKFGSRGTSERQFAGAPSSSSPLPQAQLGRAGKGWEATLPGPPSSCP